MSRVMPITGALAVAMLATAPGAFAQDTAGGSPWPTVRRTPTVTSTIAAADSIYIRQAIRGNFLEVALGRLADSRAADSAVKEFAERMITEHNSMNEQWASLAQRNGMKVEADFSPAGEQAIERLEDLEDAEFDQAYMAEMIRDHEQDLAAFQRTASSARSPEVRQLASSGLPIIRQHLALAQQVGSRVGVSTTAARAGGVTAPTPTPSEDRARRTTDRATRDEREDRGDRNDRAALRAEDRAFVQEVIMDHLMHIRLAERAQRQAKSDDVRQLAKQIEERFENWQDRWENLADRYKVQAPDHLGRLHAQKVERLDRASKGQFDRTYTAIVADHLASVVPYFKKEGQEVRPAAVRRLVDEELPVIREFLARARRLENQASNRREDADRK